MRIAPITFELESGVPGLGTPPLVPSEGRYHRFLDTVSGTKAVPEGATHTVTRGQNLWRICRDALAAQGKNPGKADVHRAVMQVAKTNGLRDPDLLSVGQKLDLTALRDNNSGVRDLSAAVSAQAKVGALANAVTASEPAPRTINAPVAAVPPSMPVGPQKAQRYTMPNRTQRFAMPELSGAGKNGSAIGLPKVTTSRVPPLTAHPVKHARPLGGGSNLQTAASRKSVDISGLIQSILEPGSMNERAEYSESPWSRILGGPARLTSKFGMRKDPFSGLPQFHDGVDIAAKSGTEVFPSMPGKVTFSGWKPGYGKVVVVEHPNGLETVYGHTSKNLVKAGDTVTTETAIAEVGSTGRSTGPHLHFEVRRNDVAFDPMPLLTGESLHVAQAL